jgi:aminoglycoside phosphotransferase (APT) family kinase protein
MKTIEPWRALVDSERVAQWMDGCGLGSGPLEAMAALTGGTQNVLVTFRRSGRDYVLRRPPAHPVLDGTQTMRREARVLGALADTSVPHPRLIASCNDKSVLGAGFYLMEPVDGFSPAVSLPEPYASDPDLRRHMGFAMIDALVKLGAVDHVAVGLVDFGKLDGYIDRQISRWRGQLESYRDFAGWPGPAQLTGLDTVSSWLKANRPADFRPGIVHGDYSLGNVMFAHGEVRVMAIVDWELATLGDPLIDLGWLLATWPDSEGVGLIPKLEVHPWQGFPRPDELVAHYAMGSGRDMSNMRWFTVLACFKLAVLLEGTHARALAGKAPMELGLSLHRAAILVLAKARTWIDGV